MRRFFTIAILILFFIIPFAYSKSTANVKPEMILSYEQIDALHIKALKLKDEGKYSEAEKIFNKILAVEPENANAHFDLGNTYLAQKKYSKALNHYKEANRLGLDGGMDSYYFNLSLCYAGLGNNKEAMKCLEKCLKLNSNYQGAKDMLEMVKEADKNGERIKIDSAGEQRGGR